MEPAKPPDAEPAAPGSVADTAARLFLWARRAPKGLARVEYDNEFARRAVVDELRRKCEAADIPFHEIDLPVRWPAADVVLFLDKQLSGRAQGGGVVSINGLATAFDPNVPLVDSLRVLNFNRDRLARFPLRQIWWMTPAVTDIFLRELPDLNSWFLVRLHLSEAVAPPTNSPLLISPAEERVLVNLADAERQATYLVDRLHKALNTGASVVEVSDLAFTAVRAMREAGAVQEAGALAARLLRQMAETFLQPEIWDSIQQDSSEVARSWDVALNGEDTSRAEALYNIGMMYGLQGKSSAAEALYLRSLTLAENSLGEDDPSVAAILWDLGALYGMQRRYADAKPLLERALQIDEKTYSPDHPIVSRSLNNVANVYSEQGLYAEAEPLYKRALAISEKILGPYHPDVAVRLNNLAVLYLRQGRYAETETLIQRAMMIDEKTLGPDHPAVATQSINYASLLRAMGRVAEAEAMEARAATIRSKHLSRQR